MTEFRQILDQLETGQEYSFKDWPNPKVPQVAAGVYTVWEGDHFIYVGMAGRGLSEDDIRRKREQGEMKKALYARLGSHASGKRGGDQFCLYICDRFVIASLNQKEITRVAAGELCLDDVTKDYIHTHLSYRFVEVRDGETASKVETMIRKGALSAGRSFLNPL